jgi:hypothetical protein
VAPTILVVIRDDPRKSHRPVEGLRIALGLSTGQNPLTIILLKEAPVLLTRHHDEIDDILDGEILERHPPVIKELALPFVVPQGTGSRFQLDPAFAVREVSRDEISSLVAHADRVLVF